MKTESKEFIVRITLKNGDVETVKAIADTDIDARIIAECTVAQLGNWVVNSEILEEE